MDCSTNVGRFAPPVFCDWLDVTFAAGSPLWDDIAGFLSDHRAESRRIADNALEFRLPDASWGNFQLQESTRGWSRLSASGGSCGALRAVSAFGEYLSLIGAHPHSVTRLDATMDIRTDAPPVIAALCNQYPPGSLVYLTRKGVKPDYYLKPIGAGLLTGTFYAGPLRSRGLVVTAKVYDKHRETFDRTGEDIGPLVRYEVVCRKRSGATLRDAHDPTGLFWHFASPALLPRPALAPAWTPFTDGTWSPGALPVDVYQRLRRRVEGSVDLETWKRLAGDLPGDGRMEVLRMVRNALGLRHVAIQ